MLGHLYLVTNTINGKHYIGKTYNSVSSRWSQHLRDAKKQAYKDRPLYRAINKHGAEAFKVELLATIEEDLLEVAEQEAITAYDSYGRSGYNATRGGDGRRYVDEQSVIDGYKTATSTVDLANKLSIDNKTVRRILDKNSVLRKKATTQTKSVYVVEADMLFSSVTDCAKFLISCEIPDSSCPTAVESNISRVCNGHRKSYKSLTFKYVDSV